jgi:hypothetical protein
MKQLFITFIINLLFFNLQAQTLDGHRNSFRAGDVIIKQQVEFKDPGASGKDIIWDFSNLNSINDKYQLTYFYPDKSDSSHVTGVEHQTYYHYELKSDTIWLTGYENRTTKMDYQFPEALLRFPFRYGDTLRTTFNGKGLYCQKIDLVAGGYTKVSIDATGKLITPENDTLKNVLRILRIKEFSDIGADSVQMHTDSIRMRMETYQWFARGSRYPVFETIKTFTILKDSMLENFSTSFYFSSVKREQLQEDLANSNLQNDTSDPDNILINCSMYPNPVTTDLTVNYELSVDAHVSFLLCDISGLPWANVPNRSLTAGLQQQKISMGGLHSGDYGLYISVNNKVYKRTIIKL